MGVALRKGQKIDLTKDRPELKDVVVCLGWGESRYSGSNDFNLQAVAFLLSGENKAASNADFVYSDSSKHISGAVKLLDADGGDKARLRVKFALVPQSVERIAVALTIYDAEARRQNFGQVRDAKLRLVDAATNEEIASYTLEEGSAMEASVVVGELYRYKGEWKFNTVGSGFKGGMQVLCSNYGITSALRLSGGTSSRNASQPSSAPQNRAVSQPSSAPRNRAVSQPSSAPRNRAVSQIGAVSGSASRTDSSAPASRVPSSTGGAVGELRRGIKTNLNKRGSSFADVLMNVDWNRSARQQAGMGSSDGIHMDVGCFYELQDGTKGVVQSLGNTYGSLDSVPYIELEEEDLPGGTQVRETLHINGAMVSSIKRILVYSFIYDGTADWQAAKGSLSVKCAGNRDLLIKIDELNATNTICAIAMLENNGSTLSVEKVARFFSRHREMDQAFNWGLQWVARQR